MGQVRRVRLVAVNPDRFSLGLAYLHAALARRFGSEVYVEQCVHDLAELHHREIDLGAVAAGIVADSPAVVGLSWYCWNHRVIQDLAWLVHELAPQCQLVVGGPETGTLVEAELIAFPTGTLFVFGEGETTFTEIVRQVVEDGGVPANLPAGTARRAADRIVRAPRCTAALAPALVPSPVLTGTVLDASSNWLPSYATTRGCVYNCSFCAWQDGFREREFDLDVVLRELDVLARRDYDRIWITDTIFGRDESRTLRILERMQRWPTRTRFAVELHARFLSDRLAAELAGVRLAWAAVGVQSLAPDVLRLSRRSPYTDQLLAAVERLYRVLDDPSVIHLDIIFGLPRQTVDDCFHTVDVLLRSFPRATIFTGMLQVIAGTAVESLRGQPGWVVLPPEADCEIAATPDLGPAEMQRIRDLSVGLDAHVVARGPGSPAMGAAELEALGRSLRHTAFGRHPVYGRREQFGADQLRALMAAAEVAACPT